LVTYSFFPFFWEKKKGGKEQAQFDFEKERVPVTFEQYLLTEEIRLKIFGSADSSVFLIDLLSDGDFVYSGENLLEILGTPVKSCLICKGNAVKTCWNFWQS